MTLVLDRLSIAVPGKTLLADFSLSVPGGEIVTIMGPSGSGKTMLLNYLTGHLPQGVRAEGSVRLGDRRIENLPPERRGLGMLFQDDLLFPHMSLGENLMFAVPRTIKGRRDRRCCADRALSWAQLEGLFDRDVDTLSGGQRSRAALMRALLAEPSAMLLDEPFTALDSNLKNEIRTFTFDHLKTRGIPTLLVTHDPTDAQAAGGPVLEPWKDYYPIN